MFFPSVFHPLSLVRTILYSANSPSFVKFLQQLVVFFIFMNVFNTFIYQIQPLDTILIQFHRIPSFPLECPETHKFVDLGPPPACNQR
jgi:hypothetical protein